MEQTYDIQSAFDEAPEVLQDYLLSSAFDDDIQNLAISEKLPPESFQILKNVTLMIALGLGEPFEFTNTLATSLVITDKTANDIVSKIGALTEKIIENMLDASNETEVKNIAVPGDNGSQDLRTTILNKGETKETVAPQAPAPKTFMSSRSMLMDQLSLIGQIPKDEDVMTRLNKIKEQLRKGEDEKKRLDAEIKAREEKEKYKHALKPTNTVPRKVYDVDPYREQVEEPTE